MRVVSDAKGVRRVEVDCPDCGHFWQSNSRSGRTTCPECGQRVYIPVALRREAYDPAPVISYAPDSYDPDAPTDPEASRREMERIYEEMGPLPKFPAPRPLKAQQRRDLGFEPEPPARPPSQTPKSWRSPKRPQGAPGAGWLVGLAAAGVMAWEIAKARKAGRAPPPGAGRDPTALGLPTRPRQTQPSAQPPGQYVPRRWTPPRATSRAASSVAKLSCLHTVVLRGWPSELLGGFVGCPQCRVNVIVVEAEPARSTD